MTFQIIKGDLFDPSHNFDGLAQGVNTKGIMGAGIAVEFRKRWPAMFEEYKTLCNEFTDVLPGLLHTYTPPFMSAPVEAFGGDTLYEILPEGPVIFNLFSQDYPGRNGSYEYLAKAALLMRLEAESQGLDRVGLPWIGCGIAGLERHNVQHHFTRILGTSEIDFTLVAQ